MNDPRALWSEHWRIAGFAGGALAGGVGLWWLRGELAQVNRWTLRAYRLLNRLDADVRRLRERVDQLERVTRQAAAPGSSLGGAGAPPRGTDGWGWREADKVILPGVCAFGYPAGTSEEGQLRLLLEHVKNCPYRHHSTYPEPSSFPTEGPT